MPLNEIPAEKSARSKNKGCPCGSGKKYKHCCYLRETAEKKTVWAPALLFLAVAAYVIVRSTTQHNYPQYAFWVQNDTLNALSISCWVLAGAALLLPPFRRWLAEHLDSLSKLPLKRHVLWIGLTFLGLLTWLSFIRFCQYRAYLLPLDTLADLNGAYGFSHYGDYYFSQFGVKAMSIHFCYLSAFFSPLLLIWNSSIPLLFMQELLICSAPLALYCLTYYYTSSSLAAFSGFLLTAASPAFYEMLTANFDMTALAAFLPWALLAFYHRRWVLLALLVVMMVGTREQVPFMFFGGGLYAIYALGWRKPKSWAIGLTAAAGAWALFFLEMKFIGHMSSLEARPQIVNFGMYQHLVPSGTPDKKILLEILTHPFRTLFIAGHPIYRYYPLGRCLFAMGLFPLFSPLEMLPFLTTFAPHFLAAQPEPTKFFDYHPGTYWDLCLHEASYTFGPLLVATAFGLRKAHQKLSATGRQSWLLVWVFFVAGLGFKYAHRTLHPNWRTNWFDSMPRVQALVPPKARLWTDEYASAPLAVRRWIKVIGWSGIDETHLFKPDYALFDKAMVVHSQTPYRERLLTFFAQNGFGKAAEDGSVVLLKAPWPQASEKEIPEWIQLPQPDAALAGAYAQYLLNSGVLPFPKPVSAKRWRQERTR